MARRPRFRRHHWQIGVDSSAETSHEICGRCSLMRRPRGRGFEFKLLGFVFPWQRRKRLPPCPATWVDFPSTTDRSTR